MSEPIEEEYQDVMTALAKTINDWLNKSSGQDTGFVLLTFNFDQQCRINYISNCNREDVLVAMKEFIAHNEGKVVTTEEIH